MMYCKLNPKAQLDMKKQLICGFPNVHNGRKFNQIGNKYQERVLQGRMGIKEDSQSLTLQRKNWHIMEKIENCIQCPAQRGK